MMAKDTRMGIFDCTYLSQERSTSFFIVQHTIQIGLLSYLIDS